MVNDKNTMPDSFKFPEKVCGWYYYGFHLEAMTPVADMNSVPHKFYISEDTIAAKDRALSVALQWLKPLQNRREVFSDNKDGLHAHISVDEAIAQIEEVLK